MTHTTLTLRDHIVQALAAELMPRYGGPQHRTPGGLPLTATAEEIALHRAQPLADAVLAALSVPACTVARPVLGTTRQPETEAAVPVCMCHAAEPLREWAAERKAADTYARAINTPPSEATCEAIRERLESGTAPRRRVRRVATEVQQPTPAPAEETK